MKTTKKSKRSMPVAKGGSRRVFNPVTFINSDLFLKDEYALLKNIIGGYELKNFTLVAAVRLLDIENSRLALCIRRMKRDLVKFRKSS